MSAFSQRHKGYKLGLILLVISTFTATWGVMTPGWTTSDNVDATGFTYYDLWFTNCETAFTGCQTTDFSNADVSFLATLGLSCVGLMLAWCSSVVVLRLNFCFSVITYGRAAELLALFAGFGLFIGCMIYIGDNVGFMEDCSTLHFGPTFILTLTSSILIGGSGILLSLFNKRPGTSFYCRFRSLTVNTPTSTFPGHSCYSATITDTQRVDYSRYQSGYGFRGSDPRFVGCRTEMECSSSYQSSSPLGLVKGS